MAKRKSVALEGTEPGFDVSFDTGAIEPQISSISSFFHPTDDEIELTGEEARTTGSWCPPDGKTTGTISVTVTKNDNPVSGERVDFHLSYVRPKGDWRSANGMKELYKQNKGDGAKAECLVNQGVIRVIGTLNATSAITGENGVASVTYQTSHIGSDFSQSSQAREKIVATLNNDKKSTLNLNIGWAGLQKIQSVSGGLRVLGARGEHVHPVLHKFLKRLGDTIKRAKWPHPLTITAASLRWGGQYPPHFTHKHGLTLDLRPMSKDGKSTCAKQDGSAAGNYDLKRTKMIIRVLKDFGGTVFFNGKSAGGQIKNGHNNHIHVSWLSSNISLVAKPENVIT